MNTLFDYYKKYRDLYAERTLFVKEELTYAAAFDMAKRRAAFLRAQGYKPGDVIGILAVNHASWMITYMALTMSGMYALLLDTNLTEDIYKEMLGIVKAKALFISEGFSKMSLGLPTLQIQLTENMGELKDFELPALTRETIASLSFTSGTTGNAKVVPLTHWNVLRTSVATAERFGEKFANKTVYAILPIYHVYGMACSATAPIAAGSRIVFQTSLKAPDILSDLQQYKVNVFPAVPRIWENFLVRIKKRFEDEKPFKQALLKYCIDHGHTMSKFGLKPVLNKLFRPIQNLFGGELLFGVTGGAALKTDYQQAYMNMGVQMCPGYGLTETVGPIVVSRTDVKKLGTVGKPTTGNFMEIRNANNEGIGEVWLKGDSVFPGYYQNEAATKAVFDNNGWFNSGDLGFIDRDGDLHLCGRKKNVIVLDSGKNVYPEDIVAYYKKSPLISEMSVFGRQIKGKEGVYAVIVPEHKDKDAYHQIDQALRKLSHGLPTYKRIGAFAISFDVLPKTSKQSIKDHEVMRNLDKGMYQTAIDDPNFVVKELVGKSPEEETILDILRKKLNVDVLYVNQKLDEDFEIDSLDNIELISDLEKQLGITIDTERFLNSKNMQELVLYLSAVVALQKPQAMKDDLLASIIKTPLTLVYNPLLELLFLVVRTLSKMFWGVKVENRDKLTPKNAIVTANHSSFLDSLWLLSFMKNRKDIYIAVKKEYGFLKYLLPGFNFIFVDREGNKFIPILKAEADILRQGKSLIIFPEGTRTATGKVGPFRTGAAFLAKNLNKKLVPVTINGTYQILPRSRRFPKFFTRHHSSVIAHDPIDPANYSTLEAITDTMKEVIVKDLK